MSDLPIALTFDLDPDYFDESVAPTEGRTQITWRCISEGIALVREQLFSIAPKCKPTWFVRVDNQIADIWGRPAWLLDEYGAIFEDLAMAGEEIAWHPHLYRREGDGWVQETRDQQLFEAMSAALKDMRAMGHHPHCGRIGEAYGSNGLMAAYDRLELAFDSTAMPGRRRIDGERMLDWEPTPNDAYRPSEKDYRVPGEPARKVVEIPFSMLKVKAVYDPEPFLRYLDLSYQPVTMAAGLDDLIAAAPYLVTVTHPSAVISDFEPAGGHGMVSFDPKAVSANLQAILRTCERTQRTPRFVTISALGEELKARLDGRG